MAGTSESGTSSRVNSNLLHKESEPFKGTEPPPDHLSPAQERRLRTWLEEQFLALDQMYNKRNEPSSPLPNLQSYLSAIKPISIAILQIPPNAAVMRMNFFLRLTVDLFERCGTFHMKGSRQRRRGAHPNPNENGHGTAPEGVGVTTNQGRHLKDQEEQGDTIQALKYLLECFALFDEGWIAILLARRWNTQAGQGAVDGTRSTQPDEQEKEKEKAARMGISETMKAMVRSTMVSGRATVEDWFERVTREHGNVIGGDVKEAFAEIFWKTLGVLEGDDEEDDWESVWDEDEGARIHSEDAMDVDLEGGDPGMFHGFDDL